MIYYKDNGIRFFALTNEFDLYDEDDRFIINLKVSVYALSARKNARKALINRIARAKRNIPTAGNLPYGRLFNKKTETWGLDIKKVRKVEQAADDYLNNMKFHNIALKYDFTPDHLHKIFRNSCGNEFPIRFRSKKLNIDETVILKIPRLLSEEKIEAIKQQTQANMTYRHDQRTHKYLLGRMIFCGHCNHAMHGTAWLYKDTKRKYYVHLQRSGKKEIDCVALKNQKYVKAKDIEDAVMVRLFAMFGDIAGMEKAMRKAIPNTEEIKRLWRQKETLKKQIQKMDIEKNRIVKAIAKGIIDDKDAMKQMEELKKRDALLTQEVESINSKTKNIPTDNQIKRRTSLIKRTIESAFTSYPKLTKMSFDSKRALLQSVFGGKDTEGKRHGVYVTRDNEGFHYVINGGFGKVGGNLPMTKKEALRILQVETDYVPDFDPLLNIDGQDQRFIVKILPQRVISFKLQGKFKIASAS